MQRSMVYRRGMTNPQDPLAPEATASRLGWLLAEPTAADRQRVIAAYTAGPPEAIRGALHAAWSLSDIDGDSYTDATTWLLAIADVLHHIGADVPAHWRFVHGPYCDGRGEDWPRSEVAELWASEPRRVTMVELTAFGNWLDEQLLNMRHAGMDQQ